MHDLIFKQSSSSSGGGSEGTAGWKRVKKEREESRAETEATGKGLWQIYYIVHVEGIFIHTKLRYISFLLGIKPERDSENFRKCYKI